MSYRIETTPGRLVSLDVLRGLDMFLLTALGATLRGFGNCFKPDWFQPVMVQLDHVSWQGFSVQDIIMPLFMFCAGTAIPYSMAKYRTEGSGSPRSAYLRIFRRFIVLWILGMAVQGNLLDLDLSTLKLFSNTLQSIAVGYLACALLYLHTSWRTQVLTGVSLLALFWALMMFVTVDGYGGGDFTPEHNLAEWTDRVVLGSWRDQASVILGILVFKAGYTYTWILSSLTFIVTVMTGMLAGEILRSRSSSLVKFLSLLLTGSVLLVLGLLWDQQMPIIKHIWTSSMVLFSSGICFILLALCFLVSDWMHLRILHWLIPIGTNCMLAYLAAHFVHFGPFFKGILYGLEQYIGTPCYDFLIILLTQALFMLMFDLLHKNRVFFRV